ncbi:DNA repair protein RecO [Candidatus Omnitrophota bacterium]
MDPRGTGRRLETSDETMAAQNAEGIILRKYLLRETSYILVVYTKEFGKIRGVIKGVRSPYPQFAGDFEIFTRCDLLFYRKQKKPMDLITRCEAIEPFIPARKDIERLTYANYFIELIDVVTDDYDQSAEIYDILVKSLEMLSAGSSPRRTARVFEMKLLGALGLSPQLEECVACGAEVSGRVDFSVKNGGLLCPKCASGESNILKVSPGTLKFLRKVRETDFDRITRVKVSKEVGRETEKMLKWFMLYHVGRPVKSLKFLAQLQKTGIV